MSMSTGAYFCIITKRGKVFNFSKLTKILPRKVFIFQESCRIIPGLQKYSLNLGWSAMDNGPWTMDISATLEQPLKMAMCLDFGQKWTGTERMEPSAN